MARYLDQERRIPLAPRARQSAGAAADWERRFDELAVWEADLWERDEALREGLAELRSLQKSLARNARLQRRAAGLLQAQRARLRTAAGVVACFGAAVGAVLVYVLYVCHTTLPR